VIGNDGGGVKEKVRSSGCKSFQSRGAVMDMAQLENMRWEVTGGWKRVKQDDEVCEVLAKHAYGVIPLVWRKLISMGWLLWCCMVKVC